MLSFETLERIIALSADEPITPDNVEMRPYVPPIQAENDAIDKLIDGIQEDSTVDLLRDAWDKERNNYPYTPEPEPEPIDYPWYDDVVDAVDDFIEETYNDYIETVNDPFFIPIQ